MGRTAYPIRVAATDDAGSSDERRALCAAIDAAAPEALALARWMNAHPELSLQERETSARFIAPDRVPRRVS